MAFSVENSEAKKDGSFYPIRRVRQVADIASAKALTLEDEEVLIIPGKGYYRYDVSSVLDADDSLWVIEPDDSVGRLIHVERDTYLQTGRADAKMFGAKADGTTDDQTALSTMDSATGFNILSRGTYLVNSDLTLSSHTAAESGAILKPASGVTITLNSFEGDLSQHFDLSLGGSISVLQAQDIQAVWFGHEQDEDADNTTAISGALSAAAPGSRVITPSGDGGKITSEIDVSGLSDITLGPESGLTVIRSGMTSATQAFIFGSTVEKTTISSPLGADITAGDRTFTADDGSKYSPGDFIALTDPTEGQWGDTNGISAYKKGEYNLVTHVSGNTVAVAYPFKWSHAASTVTDIQIFESPIQNVVLKNIEFRLTDAQHKGINFNYARNVRLQNVHFKGEDVNARRGANLLGANIRLIGGSAEDIYISSEGYGVGVAGLDIEINGFSGRNVRHLVSSASRSYLSTDIRIVGCTLYGDPENDSSSIDFHALVRDGLIESCNLYNAFIHARCSDLTIRGNTLRGHTDNMIWLSREFEDYISNVHTSGNRLFADSTRSTASVPGAMRLEGPFKDSSFEDAIFNTPTGVPAIRIVRRQQDSSTDFNQNVTLSPKIYNAGDVGIRFSGPGLNCEVVRAHIHSTARCIFVDDNESTLYIRDNLLHSENSDIIFGLGTDSDITLVAIRNQYRKESGSASFINNSGTDATSVDIDNQDLEAFTVHVPVRARGRESAYDAATQPIVDTGLGSGVLGVFAILDPDDGAVEDAVVQVISRFSDGRFKLGFVKISDGSTINSGTFAVQWFAF